MNFDSQSRETNKPNDLIPDEFFPNRQQKTILHVDDDPDFLRLIRVKLKNAGIKVVSEVDPRNAIRAQQESDAHIVLMDVNMPWIDGITLLEEIKKHDGGTQVIMLTGLVSISTVLESMRKGAEACIFKPLDSYDELLSIVNCCFEKSERWWRSLQDLCDRRNCDSATPLPFQESAKS